MNGKLYVGQHPHHYKEYHPRNCYMTPITSSAERKYAPVVLILYGFYVTLLFYIFYFAFPSLTTEYFAYYALRTTESAYNCSAVIVVFH